MAYSYDAATNRITLPRGDTATIPVRVSGDDAPEGSAVVFVVWDTTGNALMLKKHSLVSQGLATIRIASEDTRSWDTSASYGWSIGIVTEPNIDPDTGVYAGEATDEVVSAFDKLQRFVLTNGGVMGIGTGGH